MSHIVRKIQTTPQRRVFVTAQQMEIFSDARKSGAGYEDCRLAVLNQLGTAPSTHVLTRHYKSEISDPRPKMALKKTSVRIVNGEPISLPHLSSLEKPHV